MVDFTLQAQTPLRGYYKQFGDTSVRESSGIAIYSIGLALDSEPALIKIKSSLGADWPETGSSTNSSDGAYRLLGLQSDQVFVLVSTPSANAEQVNKLPNLGKSGLDKCAYITDQSDSWATLQIDGASATLALERMCPIDLHTTVFGIGQVTRTSMEHLAVIILREADNRYLLMSPTSSANSFQHAVETSLRNVIE